MKTKIGLLLAIGALTLTTSCTDLDTPVNSQYTTFPNSEVALEAQLSSVYNQLRGVLGRRYMEAMALSRDEATAVSYSGGWVDADDY